MQNDNEQKIPEIFNSGGDGSQRPQALSGELLNPTDSPYKKDYFASQCKALLEQNDRAFANPAASQLLLAKLNENIESTNYERTRSENLQKTIDKLNKDIQDIQIDRTRLHTEREHLIRSHKTTGLLCAVAGLIISITFLPDMKELTPLKMMLIALSLFIYGVAYFLPKIGSK